MLLNTDGYHLTMGYLVGNDAMKMETHILYARSGGPMVVPNLEEIVENYLQWRPSQSDIEEADEYWQSQGVPFNRQAAEHIAEMPNLPISVRGVRAGEVVRPGEPIAVIKAPAFLAAIPEPVFIGEIMTSVQVATRFTKIAKALSWQRSRVFEVGMRADRMDNHIDKIKLLAKVGLGMSSSGTAAKQAGIRSGGSMGHHYTQRFDSDYEAFMQAVDRILEFKHSRNIQQKVKLSFLLDTRDTLQFGLPDALQVIEARYDEIAKNIDLSVRLDSGDLALQLKFIIKAFLERFDVNGFMPAIIVESGLTAVDIAKFEKIANELGFPLEKMLYGVGGYLVGAINRDFVSMVYKVATYNDGIPTMKFADEANKGKESIPGEITLMERQGLKGIERQIALLSEVESLKRNGWNDLFQDICVEGLMQAEKDLKEISSAKLLARINERWDNIAAGYIGDEKYPKEFALRPDYSEGVETIIEWIRFNQLERQDEQQVVNFM